MVNIFFPENQIWMSISFLIETSGIRSLKHENVEGRKCEDRLRLKSTIKRKDLFFLSPKWKARKRCPRLRERSNEQAPPKTQS